MGTINERPPSVPTKCLFGNCSIKLSLGWEWQKVFKLQVGVWELGKVIAV